MIPDIESRPPRFYFALPRLMAKWHGAGAIRAEENATEAWSAGIAVYGISYLFFARLIPDSMPWWEFLPFLLLLAFVVMLFWLLVLYLNTLVIRALRFSGLLARTPDRHAQSTLIGAIATVMAGLLLRQGSWPAEIAAVWITALVLNLAAAAILSLMNGSRPGH